MSDFLAYGFMQRALVTGLALGITCAVLGMFVVLRRLAFVGVGLSHAALGGVALGLFLGAPPVAAALLFTVLVAWGIAWTGGSRGVSEDTAIGIFFPTAMALGVVLLSGSDAYRQDLMGYLFGSILSVRPSDVPLLLFLCAASLGLVGIFNKELLFWCLDEEGARAAGIHSTRMRYLLLTVLAFTVVAGIRLVGIVLVSAFLVVPAATGQAVARSMKGMLIASVAASVTAVLGGLWASWQWNLPSGAAIVLVSAALFFLATPLGRRLAPVSPPEQAGQ